MIEPLSGQPVAFGPLHGARNFRYDRSLGYLFLDHIDNYDNMYYARITKLSEQIKGAAKWSIVWEKVRCPPEQEPLFFKGAFETKNNNELIGIPPNWPMLWHEIGRAHV